MVRVPVSNGIVRDRAYRTAHFVAAAVMISVIAAAVLASVGDRLPVMCPLDFF